LGLSVLNRFERIVWMDKIKIPDNSFLHIVKEERILGNEGSIDKVSFHYRHISIRIQRKEEKAESSPPETEKSDKRDTIKDEYRPSNKQDVDTDKKKGSAEKQKTKRNLDERVSDFVRDTKEPVTTEFKLGKSLESSKNPNVLTIIHTNDLHGNLDPNYGKGGMAYVAGKINEIKQHNPDYILVDGGDIAYMPPYSDRNRFNPMPEMMNKIGYDVAVTGNHEFQWEAKKYGGPYGNPNPNLTDNLKELQEHTKFPFICANAVREDTGERPDFLKPYIIKKVGDVNVGVVGVVTKDLSTGAHPLVGEGWEITDQSEALKKTIPEMRAKGADVIVVLSHDDLGFNKRMIRRTPGIDIVIGGHDHQSTDKPIIVTDPDGKEVPLIEAGAYGYMVGELRVEVDPDSKKLQKVVSTLYPVRTESTNPDSEINEIVQKWKDR